jgi:hypothetical protein
MNRSMATVQVFDAFRRGRFDDSWAVDQASRRPLRSVRRDYSETHAVDVKDEEGNDDDDSDDEA